MNSYLEEVLNDIINIRMQYMRKSFLDKLFTAGLR